MSLGQTLINLQDIDLDILRLKKGIEQLPEKQAYLKAVKTHKELQQKLNAIVGKRKDIEIDIEDIQSEAQEVSDKIASIEQSLNTNTDSRLVFNLNRDLAGQVKRKEKLEFNQDNLLVELEKISSLEEKAQQALAKLIEVEESNKLAIQSQISASQEELASLQSERESEIQHLSEVEYENYELLRERKNGIAVARLLDNGCAVCGAQFNDAQLKTLKTEDDVSVCPSCGRLLVQLDSSLNEEE